VHPANLAEIDTVIRAEAPPSWRRTTTWHALTVYVQTVPPDSDELAIGEALNVEPVPQSTRSEASSALTNMCLSVVCVARFRVRDQKSICVTGRAVVYAALVVSSSDK
jgi:hypothetical protein